MKNAARACTTNNYSFLFRKFHLWYQRMNLFFCVLCCQRTWLWYKRFFLYLLLQLNCTYSNRIRRDEKKPSIIKSEACVMCSMHVARHARAHTHEYNNRTTKGIENLCPKRSIPFDFRFAWKKQPEKTTTAWNIVGQIDRNHDVYVIVECIGNTLHFAAKKKKQQQHTDLPFVCFPNLRLFPIFTHVAQPAIAKELEFFFIASTLNNNICNLPFVCSSANKKKVWFFSSVFVLLFVVSIYRWPDKHKRLYSEDKRRKTTHTLREN